MPIREKLNLRADDSKPLTAERGPRWGRPLALVTVLVFLVSSAFPVAAGLAKNTASFPKWWGVVDVGLALVLAVLALGIMAAARGKVDKPAIDASYRAYRILNHGIFVMLVLFFLFGDRIAWANCLTGFAWRAWLLLYVLPEWFTTLRIRSTEAS